MPLPHTFTNQVGLVPESWLDDNFNYLLTYAGNALQAAGGTYTIGDFVLNQTVTTPDGDDTFEIHRISSSTGGTFGYTRAALQVVTDVSSTPSNFEWNALFQLNNSATGPSTNPGAHVAMYAQANVEPGCATPTWASTLELVDRSGNANPANGRTTVELDNEADGADTSNNRVILDCYAKNHSNTGTAVFAFGIRVNATTNTQINNGIALNGALDHGILIDMSQAAIGGQPTVGVAVGGTLGIGIDFAGATLSGPAIRLAAGQSLAEEATGVYGMNYSTTAGIGGVLAFTNSGAESVGISQSTGAEGLRVLGKQVVGHQGNFIPAPLNTGDPGEVVDSEARVTINQIRAALIAHGLIASS